MRILFDRVRRPGGAHVLNGLFIARRDLLKGLRARVLPGSGLTPENAEILLELYAAHGTAASRTADAEGYIPIQDLRGALDYSAGLLSRRIGWLCQRRWIETKRALPDVTKGLHGNCLKVRITEAGTRIAEPVWLRYEKLADRLLAGIPEADLTAHYRVNELISEKLRAPQTFPETKPAIPRPVKAAVEKPAPLPAVKKSTPAFEPSKKYLWEVSSEFVD